MVMNTSNAAGKVYAVALFEIGKQTGRIGRFIEELQTVMKVIDDDKEFRLFYNSPKVSVENKAKLLEKVFKSELEPEVFALINILNQKSRELLLDNILDNLVHLLDQSEDKIHVNLTVAVPLDDGVRSNLQTELESITSKKVIIHVQVDPAVIGGIVLRIDDRVLDGSVRKHLADLCEQAADIPMML